MGKRRYFLIVSVLLVFCAMMSWISTANAQDQIDSRYQRNGEVYLLIGKQSNIPGSGDVDYRGVWRLNDPEGVFTASPPHPLIQETDILNLAVDMDRNIFTLSDPIVTTIGDSYELMRQVVDGTDGTTASMTDWGVHAYIHTDHRNKTGYWGHKTDVYRIERPNGDITRNSLSLGPWPDFKSAGPGQPASEPADPIAYLPQFDPVLKPKVVLNYYPGKNWYKIPNGAWFSSWRTVPCDASGRVSAKRPKNADGVQVDYFFQMFADKATGEQYDWNKIIWTPPADTTGTDLLYTKGAAIPFATTYNMTISRLTLAGCLDGCGGAVGDGSVSAPELLSDVAFMPATDGSGTSYLRTYFYTRHVGTFTYSIETEGAGSDNYELKGHPTGYGDDAPDTLWLGVSMKTKTSDYLYCLGNSVIKKWITERGGNSNNMNISAVTVSNQWFQRGGIIFAYDANEKMVHKLEQNETTGVHPPLVAFKIASMVAAISAEDDCQIEDIKADGFGNLFLGLTYPTTNVEEHDPTTNWTYGDAYRLESDGLANDEGMQVGKLFYRQDYRKSVWRISALGEPPREVGQRVFATRIYERTAALPASLWTELLALPTFPNSQIDVLIGSCTHPSAYVDDFTLASQSLSSDPGQCRIAVINVPTPPEVLSLGDKKSYLDIIGPYKDSIPIPDTTNRRTNQDSKARHANPLELNQLYFLMVENYPIPNGSQNPNVDPDYDEDNRYGGFVSTIKNPNPSTNTENPGTIRYYWRTWMVEDHNRNSVCPPEPMSDSAAGTYFHWLYSPIRGKFIVTCRVDYDWWDYTKMAYGTTYADFIDLPGEADKVGDRAIPSKDGIAFDPALDCLNSIMSTPDFASMSSTVAMANTYRETILGNDDNKNYYAIYPVVVDGPVPPIPEPATETARIQRCNIGGPNDPLTPGDWFPKEDGIINPEAGYHCIRAGQSYHWRMDVASQSIFFQSLDRATNPTAYQTVADKLTDIDQAAYYVNGNPEFLFTETGDDLRWAVASAETECFLEYPVPPLKADGAPTVVRRDLGSNTTEVTSQNFSYFTSLEGLPTTDPFECELVIEMSRMFLYDMRIFHITTNSDGTTEARLLGKVPNLPKRLTVSARTKVLIVDTEKPRIDFSQTDPNQLFGITGRTLGGDGFNPTHISFRIEDNNPWEGVTGIASHADYSPFNIDHNEEILRLGSNATSGTNLKPIFDQSTRGVRMSHDLPSLTATRAVELATHSFQPGYGVFGSTIPEPVCDYLVNNEDLIFKAQMDFSTPLAVLNNGAPLVLPKCYANNSPDYIPYRFWLAACDSSGNGFSDTLLNLCIQVKDDIPPEPYGTAKEFKRMTMARFPSHANFPDDDGFAGALLSELTYNQTFVSRSNWTPSAPGANPTTDPGGVIMDGANDTGLRALWSVDSKIVPMPTAMGNTGLTPGTMLVEDNVNVLFQVGVADNAGGATATMILKYYDISGDEKETRTSTASFSSTGLTAGPSTGNVGSARAVFREGKDSTDPANPVPVKFPLLIPITIYARDDARDWSSYSSMTVDLNGWSWGALTPGESAPNERTFNTSLPVFGSELIIRTIERGLRNP